MDLPYADGFVMRLILPGASVSDASVSGASVSESALDAGTLAQVATALEAAPPSAVDIQLPKWDYKSSFELLGILDRSGLKKMLATTTDFDAIQQGFMITAAVQAANITVAEKGTIAAAVTQINGRATAAPPQPELEISFDRPFHYQIVHVETGLPLFMGKIADPR